MEFIQIAAAVYILVLTSIVVALWVRYVVTGKRASASLNGIAAHAGFLSCVICAVTTLVQID